MSGNSELKRSRAQATDSKVPSKDTESAVEPPTKKARIEESKSLFVRSLPPTTTTETLTDFFSQHFPVKHATVILDPQTKLSRGYGFVTFTDADDAKEAKEKLSKQKLDGRPLVLEIAEPRHRQSASESAGVVARKAERQEMLAEARKAPKLIVRNLPWSIKTSNQLAALFQSFGKVKYSDLPNAKGKLSGFGFVTMRGRKNAERAIEAVNGKAVDGRTLAVDWAVDKKTWEDQKHQQGDDDATQKRTKPTNLDGSLKDDDANLSEVHESQGEKRNEDDDEEDEDLKNFMKNHMENLEEEDSSADPEEAGSDEVIEDEGEDEDASESKPAPKKPLMTDNNSTVFIRNLPFTTTDAELKSHFEQFGRIRYARIVVDRATDRAAGTGFVCFTSETDLKECLKGAPRAQKSAIANKKSILQNELADEQGKYTIDGRILQVSQAVSKDEASRLAETGAAVRQGKDRDKRRLYLLSEGTVMQDSPLYAMLAPSEIKIREQSTTQRKKLIQSNPSLHLSLTRLAIRNIPRNMDSKKLKALAREAVVGFARDVKEGRRQPLSKEETARGGEEDKEAERRRKEKGKGIVKQAKIVFENKEGSKVPEVDGASKSRGYGFVEYSSHRWALMGLRWLNGHALDNATGKTQRLIVEFAIENAQVVARRQDLQAKQQMRGSQRSDEQNTKASSTRPKGKDFSVSKGRRQAAREENEIVNNKPDTAGGEGSARDTLQQKIIARKRMVRKKKAQSRR
ncbi:RNA-binding domain-containing protein [Annulohypoxylon maeteangense]|uniref:RNA-binding domain-containing protein n=1 Tax=Annulohypoxylon maeteangense TaxID=1927788 RepID=UPI0020073AEF|nr:RNA-binding domain-containing protein [Annulohypoxylon maeteangense]KAI0880835.1 RNA-binding domain-containing protein [Annulohypoxylon maeteangense]